MHWKRLAGYGFALWLVPFVLAFFLFGIRESNRALFESLITVVGVWSAVAASVLYFRDAARPGMAVGLQVGFVWAAISIIIDLPLFLGVFHMSPADYAADIALTYLAFPAITLGVALGGGAPWKPH